MARRGDLQWHKGWLDASSPGSTGTLTLMCLLYQSHYLSWPFGTWPCPVSDGWQCWQALLGEPTHLHHPRCWRSGHQLLSHGRMVWPQTPVVCKALGEEEVWFSSVCGSCLSPWEGTVLSGLGVFYFLLPVLCVSSSGSMIMWTVIRRNIRAPVYHSWSSAALMTQHTLPKSSLEDGEGD